MGAVHLVWCDTSNCVPWFGVSVIADVEDTHAEFTVWLRGLLANERMAIIGIIIIIGVSCGICCCYRVFPLSTAIKMNRVVWVCLGVSMPSSVSSFSRRIGGVRISSWWTDRFLVQKALGLSGRLSCCGA